MKYIECPEEYEGNGKSLFLAGGISNCSNWQSELVKMLDKEDMILINPRRKNFSVGDRKMEMDQIKWEHDHLIKSSAISFWFAQETLCPITLYELGKASSGRKKIFIGVHPEYARKRDVEIQTGLIRPEINVVYSLDDLAGQIKEWARD